MFYYLNNFLIYSIFGYGFETILFLILGIHNKSGFMFFPFTPFYGTGVLLIMFIYKMVEKLNLTKIKKNILLFFIFFFSLSLFEYLGGVILELLHGYYVWDYRIIPLHIGKYVSIPTSLLWTLFSFLYLYVLKKYTDKLITKIPRIVSIFLSLLISADFLYTIIRLIKHRLM